MSRHALNVVLDHVRRLADPAESADDELLCLFVAARDETAFEALVRRHGPLVYGLCRRLLNDSHAAEDVFQATFLVLARKAGSIRKRAALASWLFGVASRLARNARRKTQRRRRHEVSAADLPADPAPVLDRGSEDQSMGSDPAHALGAAEVRAALDEELARLPDKYRAPLLLCGCAGKTTAEAARDLGCPEATLKSRLRRGRELLRGRLARRGFALSVAATAALLSTAAARAVPPTLLAATARAALPFAAGQVLGGGSAQAVVLAERLLRAAALRSLVYGLVAILSLALFGDAVALRGWRAAADGPAPAAPPGEANKVGAAAVDRHGDPLPPGALARLGTVRWRHGGIVSFVAFTPDGKQLLSGGADGRARLWDAATGREVRRFVLTRQGSAEGLSLALPADGRTLASCAGEESVRVWDVSTGRELGPPKDPSPAAALLALDRAGKTLAVYGHDGSLGLWDVESGKRVREVRGAGEAMRNALPDGGTLTFSPDGKNLAAARFETRDGEPARSVLRVWDTATGKERLSVAGPDHTNGALTPAYSPDGKLLSWSGIDGVVRLADAASGKEVRQLRTGPGPARLAFTTDGKAVVTRSELSRAVAVWDVATGKELRTFGPPTDTPGVAGWGLAGVVGSLAVSPDAKLLALAGEGCAVGLLDLKTGQAVNDTGGHRAAVSALAYMPGGKDIASRGYDGAIRLWDAASGKDTGRVRVPREAMTCALSPDGKSLATTGVDNVLRVWDAKSGQERHRLPGGGNGLVAFDFASDGRTLAVADAGAWALRLYDVIGGKKTRSLSLRGPGEPPQQGVLWAGSAAPFFAPDDSFVAACVPAPAVVVWDAATGREVLRVPVTRDGRPAVSAACFSPDARTLALEWDDGSLALWELATGKESARLGEKAGREPAPADFPVPFRPPGAALAYSPDGRFLAQIRGDVVTLWDVAARTEVGQLTGHSVEITALAYAPDGKTLVTGGADGTGLVWDVSQLHRLRGRAGR